MIPDLPFSIYGPVIAALTGSIVFLVGWIRTDGKSNLDAREQYGENLRKALVDQAAANAQIVAFCTSLRESQERLAEQVRDALRKVES